MWADPESRSEGELVDALVKLAGLGYPLEVLWEMHGESPQMVERMKNLKGLPDRGTVPDPQATPPEPVPPAPGQPIETGVRRDA
jgi:hypothetical protein